MSDLIERLRKWGNSFGLAQHYLGTKSAREDCAEAATALAEAEATIARLEDVLEIVAAGPILGEPMARWINHMMAKARAALSSPHAAKGEAG
jgi:hypothetical protein